jgi:hypothetical protein
VLVISHLAAFILAPSEMRLPSGAMCPDAMVSGGQVHVLYGDGKDGWYTRFGLDSRVRVNSEEGTVHAMGERGPKIALGDGSVFAAWQGDYRKGPAVWFARTTDGKTFEAQRNLIQGQTPGLDEVAIAANGKDVAVFWLDGRGGPDSEAPTTSTIWFSLSTDGGKTFGPNTKVVSDNNVRACACCTFKVDMQKDGWATIIYRSGIGNVRDIWKLQGNVPKNQWQSQRLTTSNWVFAGCPMDGPRCDGPSLVYSVEGKCYLSRGSGEPVLLGTGKYANVAGDLATWQEGSTLHWRNLKSGESGTMGTGTSRVALVEGPDGRPLVIH